MGDTKSELDRFHEFAEEQLAGEGADLSLEGLLWLWRETNSDDAHAAITEGLADVDAGRTRPFREASDEFRRQNDLPPLR
ncbi:MAG: hypothetical protein RIC55_31130 [Pirellulaceae bacterium]